MNSLSYSNTFESKKHSFSPKPPELNGLILQVHHTIPSGNHKKLLRFMYASFDHQGFLLASADQFGHIFLIDFNKNELWSLPNIQSCTIIKFCEGEHYHNNLVIGKSTGDLQIIWSHTGEVIGDLIGHEFAIISIAFAPNDQCLTASAYEAIIWKLKTQVKVHVLNLEDGFTLKYVNYMPITYNIMACFEDDTIHIWKSSNFDALKQIMPTSWNKRSLKCFAFTRNGRAMVIGGLSQYLTVFILDTWSIERTIALPDVIYGVKQLEFVPQPFDGGANKVLALLVTKGIVYLYDMEKDEFVANVEAEEEVLRLECAFDGKMLACVLKSGEINVYNTLVYFTSNTPRRRIKSPQQSSLKRQSFSKLSYIRTQMKELLDKDKLLLILKEFKEYPAAHRVKIWAELLQLPNNTIQYNKYINNVALKCFQSLDRDYPLENRNAMRSLKRLLSNLVAWSPFFAQVDFLPLFLFPFVKVIAHDPVICFEAASSVLVNWCQYWFEYYPLPPLNTLAMIENLIVEHDPELITHLRERGVTSQVYAWPLLYSAFSEILPTSHWSILWDHVLSNEPAFLLMVVAAYCCLQKSMLYKLQASEEFEFFFHNQNPVDIHKLVAKTYTFLNKTSEQNHPRGFMEPFVKLEIGSYPEFLRYPRAQLEYGMREMEKLDREDEEIMLKEHEYTEKIGGDSSGLKEIHYEENLRMKNVEKAIREKIDQKREELQGKKYRLSELQTQLDEKISIGTSTSSFNKVKMSKSTVIRRNKSSTTLDEELINYYSEMLKQKVKADQLNEGNGDDEKAIKEHQKKLAADLRKLGGKSSEDLKELNLTMGLTAVSSLIKQVEAELSESPVERLNKIRMGKPVVPITKLQIQARELQTVLSRLLKFLAELKSKEADRRRIPSLVPYRASPRKKKNKNT